MPNAVSILEPFFLFAVNIEFKGRIYESEAEQLL